MGLFGAPEVAALSFDSRNNRVYGVKLKARKRGVFAVARYASREDAEWQQAARLVLRDLHVNSSIRLMLCMSPGDSSVFECELPDVSPEIMLGALRFEVPLHVMSVPEDFSLQYVPRAELTGDGMMPLRCAVIPGEALQDFCTQIPALRQKPDTVVNPLLTLPDEMPGDEPVILDGFEDGFCWKSGMWQFARLQENCNAALDEILRKYCVGKLMADSRFGEYRTALCGALCGIRKIFVNSNVLAGTAILPGNLRPARLRAQVWLMVLLALGLAGITVYRNTGTFMAQYKEHRKLAAEVAESKRNVQNLRKKVKAGEKELKELQRTAEVKVGSRECVGVLGYMSEKLPNDVVVNHFRWNEGSLDMNMFSNNTELDLVGFFNRLPGFTVHNATPRNFPQGVSASVKLSAFDPEQERIEELRKAREKSKAKRKAKGKK